MKPPKSDSPFRRALKAAGWKPLSEGEGLFVRQMSGRGHVFLREYEFAREYSRKYRFDFAKIVGPLKLAVEIDGGAWSQGRHNRGAGMAEDHRKLNLAAELGWTVLRYTTDMVASGEADRQVHAFITAAMKEQDESSHQEAAPLH